MVIFSVYVVNKPGDLIYQLDSYTPRAQAEKTFSYSNTFKMHCQQTLIGIKFVVLADHRQAGRDSLLQKIYEIYSDSALRNPFYSLEMPIGCELFDQNLKLGLEVAEKAGTFGPGS
uniref:Trafficking protein particle complex subunit n=1 Tax=Callithrix jacchus TaxID=9483 RepID=A0A8I3WG04_CALJA